jgi:hypothetical protein
MTTETKYPCEVKFILLHMKPTDSMAITSTTRDPVQCVKDYIRYSKRHQCREILRSMYNSKTVGIAKINIIRLATCVVNNVIEREIMEGNLVRAQLELNYNNTTLTYNRGPEKNFKEVVSALDWRQYSQYETYILEDIGAETALETDCEMFSCERDSEDVEDDPYYDYENRIEIKEIEQN